MAPRNFWPPNPGAGCPSQGPSHPEAPAGSANSCVGQRGPGAGCLNPVSGTSAAGVGPWPWAPRHGGRRWWGHTFLSARLAGEGRSRVCISGLPFGAEENALCTSAPGLLATAPQEAAGGPATAPEAVGRGLAPHWRSPCGLQMGGFSQFPGLGRPCAPGRRLRPLACSFAETPTGGSTAQLRGPLAGSGPGLSPAVTGWWCVLVCDDVSPPGASALCGTHRVEKGHGHGEASSLGRRQGNVLWAATALRPRSLPARPRVWLVGGCSRPC